MASDPRLPYLAQPPRILGTGTASGRHIIGQCWRMVCGLWTMLWVPLVPFNLNPEPFRDPPKPVKDPTPESIAQCEKIYERTESTRKFVEEKARATFAILSFLAPLLGAGFVFLITQAERGSASYRWAIVLAIASAVLTMLAFISIARATAVRGHMDLSIAAVIDMENDRFNAYDPKRYAQGLLYCASWNSGMNAHVAQFVRGGHVLISLAALFAFAASIPLGLAYADASASQASEAKLNPVAEQLAALHQDLIALRHDLAARKGATAEAPPKSPPRGTVVPSKPASTVPTGHRRASTSKPGARPIALSPQP